MKEQAEVVTEIAEAKKAVAEIEAAGDTTAKGLDAHGRATSRLAILERRQGEIEAAIMPAKRAEASARVEKLQADYNAAFANREKIMAECREKIEAWYDYPGGLGPLTRALANAKPVREANIAAMTLNDQLMGAQTHLRALK
ncbi:MAG: hypothetical protein KKF10_07320 [Verrucomicrobia bacterium]|nr:hypothetical protein [Verrucomicrobiota bacterium]